MRIYLSVAACIAVVAASAAATDRYFPDSFAISANGKYRIDARSPDNAKRRAFASGFTYTLTEVATKRVVWERKQRMTRSKGEASAWPTEGSPMGVYVSDDGYVAAHLSHENVLIVDPQGTDVGTPEILGAFPTEQQQSFVASTTAGPRWAHDSEWYFMSVPVPASHDSAGVPPQYFVIRPYWCHRLVIDLKTGKHVDLGTQHAAWSASDIGAAPERARPILKAAITEERRRAIEILGIGRERLMKENDYEVSRRLGAACTTVIHLRLVEAEPGLVVLLQYLGDSERHFGLSRQRVRETMRAIGKLPSDPASPVSSEERVRNAPKVERGMTKRELSKLLGDPDAEMGWRDKAFDYDIDASPGYTLRVEFAQDEDSVSSIKMITPFAFYADPDRLRGW